MGTTMMKTCTSQIECGLFRGSTIDPKPVRSLIVAFVAYLTIGSMAGCGGGGGGGGSIGASSPPPTPATSLKLQDQGLSAAFGGTLTGATNQDLFVVIDGQGSLWGVYGSAASTDFRVAGLFTGWSSTWPAARFISEGIDLALDSSIPSMSGSVTTTTGSRSVAGGVMPGIGYDPNAPASLNTIIGHWDLTTSEGPPLSIDIGADGVVTGGSGACRLHDSAVGPSKSGKNIFAISLRFQNGGFACPSFAGSDGVYGFALAYGLTGGGTQLVIGAWNGWDPVYLAAAGKR